jgi:DNA-binding NtrC family response regulator
LLVEGDILVRHPLAEYLRACGFVVYEASNGDEARQHLSSPISKIELVLADMTTQGSGFGLRHWISTQRLDVEVVLAASVEKAVDSAGKLCNDGPALAKPWDHHLILETIRQAIARRYR